MEKKWTPAATGWLGVRLTGKIPTVTKSGDSSRASLRGLVKGTSFSWEEGSAGKDRLKAPQPLGLVWAPGPLAQGCPGHSQHRAGSLLPHVTQGASKCQVGKLPVGESEALCILSNKWQSEVGQILIACDSPHPPTPCSRVRHSGVRTRDGGGGGGGRSRLLKSQAPDLPTPEKHHRDARHRPKVTSSWISGKESKVCGHAQPRGSRFSPPAEPSAGPASGHFPGSRTHRVFASLFLPVCLFFYVQRAELEQMAVTRVTCGWPSP